MIQYHLYYNQWKEQNCEIFHLESSVRTYYTHQKQLPIIKRMQPSNRTDRLRRNKREMITVGGFERGDRQPFSEPTVSQPISASFSIYLSKSSRERNARNDEIHADAAPGVER